MKEGGTWGSKGHQEQEGALHTARSFLDLDSLAGSMEAVTRPDLDDSGPSEHVTTAGGNSGKAWQQVRRQRLERGVELDWLHPGTFQGLTPLGIDGFLKTDISVFAFQHPLPPKCELAGSGR